MLDFYMLHQMLSEGEIRISNQMYKCIQRNFAYYDIIQDYYYCFVRFAAKQEFFKIDT